MTRPFTPSDELVEATARAICSADGYTDPDAKNLNSPNGKRWGLTVPDARAAIAVIARELGEEAAKIANRHYTASAAAIAIRAHFGVPSERAKSGSGK